MSGARIPATLLRIEKDIALLRMLIQREESRRHWVPDTDNRISNIIQQQAWVQAYVNERGARGVGDSGHEHAQDSAKNYVKRIRKTIGYTIP